MGFMPSPDLLLPPALGFLVVRVARALGHAFVRYVGDVAKFFGRASSVLRVFDEGLFLAP